MFSVEAWESEISKQKLKSVRYNPRERLTLIPEDYDVVLSSFEVKHLK